MTLPAVIVNVPFTNTRYPKVFRMPAAPIVSPVQYKSALNVVVADTVIAVDPG